MAQAPHLRFFAAASLLDLDLSTAPVFVASFEARECGPPAHLAAALVQMPQHLSSEEWDSSCPQLVRALGSCARVCGWPHLASQQVSPAAAEQRAVSRSIGELRLADCHHSFQERNRWKEGEEEEHVGKEIRREHLGPPRAGTGWLASPGIAGQPADSNHRRATCRWSACPWFREQAPQICEGQRRPQKVLQRTTADAQLLLLLRARSLSSLRRGSKTTIMLMLHMTV